MKLPDNEYLEAAICLGLTLVILLVVGALGTFLVEVAGRLIGGPADFIAGAVYCLAVTYVYAVLVVKGKIK